MKLLLFSWSFFLTIFSGFSQSSDYLVTLKGDTLRGELKVYGYKPKTFKFVDKTISKVEFDATNTRYVFYGNMDYKRVLLKSRLTKKLSPDILHLIYANDKYSLFEHIYEVTSGDGKYITQYEKRDYYIYEGEKPITEFEEWNYKKILPKYFSNCGRFVREIEHNRKITLEDALYTLTNYCK